MRGIAIAIVLTLSSIACHAQSTPTTGQCDQVRTAVAQYGLQNARKHAIEHYSLTLADLRTIEQNCGIGGRGRRAKTAARP